MVRLRVQVLHTFLFQSTDSQLQAKRHGVIKSDIEIFIENHRGPNFSNPDQLCSQSAIDALVSFYHFLILSTVVLSLTSISIISARINMVKRWCDAIGRGSTGERQTWTRWLCTLAEGERVMDGESLIDFILILCLCNAMIYSYIIHVAVIPCLMA
jgi:hypothetical protein